MPEKFEAKFLGVMGFGKDESVWISEYDSWPVDGGFRSDFTLVGRGTVASPYCGRHMCYHVCTRDQLHDGVYKGKDYYFNQVMSCHRPSCPRCWKYGWAVREARSIDSRFSTAEKVLGLPYGDVEHLAASVPPKDYGLPFEVLRRNAIVSLKLRNVIGGGLIFHGHRKDRNRRVLVWSPHFHVLGYIKGGYDRCRTCDRERGYCRGCDRFEGLTRKIYDTDDWIVEVAKDEIGRREKRKNVFGTAWYQLEHASLRVGAVRFQIVAWFGVVGNRKLKTVLNKMEYKCPLCGNELVRGYHVGDECIVANRGERGFHKAFLINHVDSTGRRNCIEANENRSDGDVV
jgi:hypothetical protein